MSTLPGRERPQIRQPTRLEVGDGPPSVVQSSGPLRGRPRRRTADRIRSALRAAPPGALVPDDPPARVVGGHVEGRGLSTSYGCINAVGHGPGRAPGDPEILVALRLHATIEGIGGARHRDKPRRDHAAFQWRVGDVAITSHTPSDFRTDRAGWLDEMLTRGVAAPLAEGLADLDRVARGGARARAGAGAASSRRRPTPEEALAQAEARAEALRAELDDDPAARDRRAAGSRRRAARERAVRVRAALGRLPELGAEKQAGEREQARCSTTDAGAPVMTMGDGGSRPAHHSRSATDAGPQVITGATVTPGGGGAGQWVPMVEPAEARAGTVPPGWLVDGGFARHDRIGTVGAPETGRTVSAPAPQPNDPTIDRRAAKPGDRAAIAAWRERAGTGRATAVYKGRAATAGGVNARARDRGLIGLLVRGLAEVRATALWHAFAPHFLCARRPRAAAAGGT